MQVLFYDIRGTHVNNPDCPMRVAPSPRGGLYCIDCGHDIIQSHVDVSEGRNLMREFLAQPEGHCTVDGTEKPGWGR